MIVIAACIALSFGAASASGRAATKPASSAASTAVPAAPKLRVIDLDRKKEKVVYKVNAAPGLATVIELPEPWATTPTCGDCVFGDQKTEGQLWRLDLSPSTRTLSLKPTRVPGADLPASAFVTNIDITLNGGIAITLFVELTLPEAADARIDFTIPDDQKGAAKLTKRERELDAKFDERVTTAATDALLAGAMHGTKCKDFGGRPNRHEDVVVRLRQICRTSALVYLTFEVEDRRHDDVALTGAVLESTRHAAHPSDKLEKPALRFNERGLGIVALPIAGDGESDRYRLKLTVHGIDEDTIVTVDDINF